MSAVCRIISRKSLQSIGMSLNCRTGRHSLWSGLRRSNVADGSGTRACIRRCAPSSSICMSAADARSGCAVFKLAQLPHLARFGARGAFGGPICRRICLRRGHFRDCGSAVITDAIVSVVHRSVARVSYECLYFDGWVRSAPVFQDRGAGGRPRCAAAGAREAGASGDAGHSEVSRRPGPRAPRAPFRCAALAAQSPTRASSSSRWPRTSGRCSSIARSSTIASRSTARAATIPTTRGASRFLCRAALEYAVQSGETFDILHAHDWQAGLAPVYLRTLLRRRAARCAG